MHLYSLIENKIKEYSSKDLSNSDLYKISHSLLYYRNFFENFDNIDFIFDKLFKNYTYDKYCIPCDLMYFNLYLLDNKISNAIPIALLPVQFAIEFCESHSLFIIVRNVRKIIDLKSIVLVEEVDIEESVQEIYVNRLLGEELLEKTQVMMKKFNYNIPISGINSIPVTSMPNYRLSSFNLKKYASNKISLTEHEQSIFSLINSVNSKYNLGVTCRVAGGWTRDKLLGVDSDDIDIAIDKMPGFKFAKQIEKYAKDYGVKNVGTAYSVSLEKSSTPNEEAPKPDLMVGGIEIFGQKIEFVPMRTETYAVNSRTPIISRTDDVREDVKRRDLTINSIYYNINTQSIEDYANGVADLETMTLRTPIDAKATLIEDPLRALRVLRFYSRYPDAKIDPELINALKDPEVHAAYQKKVAPERAGKEITKMMASVDPVKGARLLFETDLYKQVFNVPEMSNLQHITMDQRTPHHKFNLMEHTLKVLDGINKSGFDKGLSPDRRILRNLAALFHDFGKLHPEIQIPHPTNPGQIQYPGHEDTSVTVSDAIMKSIGIGDKQRNYVNKLIETHMRPHAESWTSKSIGKLMRNLVVPGQEELTDDILEDLYDHGKADEQASDPDRANIALKDQHYQQFKNYSTERAGESVRKPILNGNEIMQLFPNLKPNSGYITHVKEALLELMDENPNLTKEQALEYINQISPDVNSRFGNIKNAQHLGSPNNDEGGFPYFKDDPNTDISRVRYITSPWKEGVRVRRRKVGGAFKQKNGVITEVTDSFISVQWDNGKETRYPNDEAFLNFTFDRIF